jgi:hypothetical protein
MQGCLLVENNLACPVFNPLLFKGLTTILPTLKISGGQIGLCLLKG